MIKNVFGLKTLSRGGGKRHLKVSFLDTCCYFPLKRLKIPAFSLAEVLVTMAVIGVVAALTIPTLTASYREKEVEARLKKVYSTMSQAVKLAEVDLDKSSTSWDYSLSETEFVDRYLIKYLSALNTDAETGAGTSTSKVLIFNDGSMAKLHSKEDGLVFEFDINGVYKGANTAGVDRFWFVLSSASKIKSVKNSGGSLNPFDTLYAYSGYRTGSDKVESYTDKCSSSGGNNCTLLSELIMRNGWTIPDDYPIEI